MDWGGEGNPTEVLRLLRASEHRLASTICTFREENGYTVMRSEGFPAFYAGNGLLVRQYHEARTLDQWIALFRQHFPADRYRHITLHFPSFAGNPLLLDDAKRRQFNVLTEVLMATSPSVLVSTKIDQPRSASMRMLSKRSDLQLLYNLHLAEARGEDWFVDEEDFAELFRKTMKASKGVGVQWIGANLDRAHERLDSALGFFDEDRLCRLQEVMTAQPARGKGLATLLLREVAARAVQRGLNYVGLLAEDRSDGHRLYQKLGFRELDRDVTLMHY